MKTEKRWRLLAFVGGIIIELINSFYGNTQGIGLICFLLMMILWFQIHHNTPNNFKEVNDRDH